MSLFLSLTTLAPANTQNKGVHTCTGVYTLTKKLFRKTERESCCKWRVVISLLAVDNKCRAVLS